MRYVCGVRKPFLLSRHALVLWIGGAALFSGCAIKINRLPLAVATTAPASVPQPFSWIGSRAAEPSKTWADSASVTGAPAASGDTGLNGLLSFPLQTALDTTSGYLFVAQNSRVLRIQVSTGADAGWIGTAGSTKPAAGATGCTSAGLRSLTPGWCMGGSTTASNAADGFAQISGVAIDTAGNALFVSDSLHHKISKFNLSTGAYIGSVGSLVSSTGTCPGSGVASGWCTGGLFASDAVQGAFDSPQGIAYSGGYVYVADFNNNRIARLSSSTGAPGGALGASASASGSCGTGFQPWCSGSAFALSTNANGGVAYPTSVAVSGTTLYASDEVGKVVSYNVGTGAFIAAMGMVSVPGGTCTGAGSFHAWCSGGMLYVGSGNGALGTGYTWVTPDSVNNVLYVTDGGNHRINKYNLGTGAFLGASGHVPTAAGTCVAGVNAWCTGGTFAPGVSAGAFNSPNGTSVDPSGGYLYVADGTNGRIQRLTLAGGASGWIGGTSNTTPGWSRENDAVYADFQKDGIISSLSAGLAVDWASDSLLVADTANHRIERFSVSTGAFRGWIGKIATSPTGGDAGCAGASAGTFTAGWCTGGTAGSGAGNGMMNQPMGLAIDASRGVFYVADSGNHRLNRYNLQSGAYQGSVGNVSATGGTCSSTGAASTWCSGGTFVSGTGNGHYFTPAALVLSADGALIYVADKNNSRLARVSWTGSWQAALGSVMTTGGTCTSTGFSGWCSGGVFNGGFGDGELQQPASIALAGNYLYATDGTIARVNRYDLATGSFQGAMGNVSATGGTCTSTGAQRWCTGGTFASGSGEGMFQNADGTPFSIIDSLGLLADPVRGYLYVGDIGRVQRFDLATGAYLGSIGRVGKVPTGGDPGCMSIRAMDPTPGWCLGGGKELDSTGLSSNGGFYNPGKLALDSSGALFILDGLRGRVTRMSQ